MIYTNVTDSPLGQLLLSIEERLRSAKNNNEFKADKSEAAKETANQINKLLKLTDQLRSAANIYNQGGGPGLADLFVLPKLISLKNLSKDYASLSYKLYRFLKKDLAHIIQGSIVQFLWEMSRDESHWAQKIDQLKAQIKAALLKNVTLESLNAETIIEDLLKSTDFSLFTPDYVKRNKNNFVKDITDIILRNFKQQYLNSLLQRYAFQIKHPIMFDVIADVAKLLSALPTDDLSKLVSFLDPAAIENTSKLMSKPIIHKGNFAFEISKTKKIIDVNGLYKQYAPQSYQLIDLTIADYFRDYSETQKVKSEKAKAQLIEDTVSHLVHDCKTKVTDIILQIKNSAVDEDKLEQYPQTSLDYLIHKLDELKELDCVYQEYLAKYKNDLISRLYLKTILSEAIKEPREEFTSLLVNLQKIGLPTHAMQQDLLTTNFVQVSAATTHLMTVREYIDNVFKAFHQEIEQPLNQAKKEIIGYMDKLWHQWVEEGRKYHSTTTATITDCCKDIKKKAEQIEFELGVLPEEIELKLDYLTKKTTELSNKKLALEALQQELDLQGEALKQQSVNAIIPGHLVTLFGDSVQKEFDHLYETKQHEFDAIKTAIYQVGMTLTEQERELKRLDEKIQFEKKMSEGNVNELKNVLKNKIQALNDICRNSNRGQLQEKQEALKLIQTLKPKKELDNLQKRVNNNLSDFREVLERFSKPLTLLTNNISTEKRNQIIEALEQLVVLDSLAVIQYIETLGKAYEDDVKNDGWPELYKIYQWVDKQLIPAAKKNLSVSEIVNLFEESQEFNNHHLKKLFFDIFCPDVEINKPNSWKEFYQHLRRIFHPSIFQSDTGKANNILKLRQLEQLATDAYKILSLTNPLKGIINDLKSIDKEIAEDKEKIVTLEQEIKLREEINHIHEEEKQLFILTQEIEILDKLINTSEEMKILGDEINGLKVKLTIPSSLHASFKDNQAFIEVSQKSLQIISDELKGSNFLFQLVDSKTYQAKLEQLTRLCLALQDELTEIADSYHDKITKLFDLELKAVQTAKNEFNRLKDLEKTIREIKDHSEIIGAKINPIGTLFLQESIEALSTDSELTDSLVKKLQEYIDVLVHQAKERVDRVTINIIDVHKKDMNEMYRQEIDAANLLIEKARSEALKLKAILSKDKLAARHELIRSIEGTEKKSDKVKNELIAKQGRVSNAQSRIQMRMRLADRFKKELDNYLINRAKKYNFKDTFTSRDREARELFIEGSLKKNGLKNFLDNFIKDGNSKKLVDFIKANKLHFPGQQLQPLLNRLILAVRDYESTLPVDYSDDLSSEIYSPAIILEEATLVLEKLQKNNTTKALAIGIKKLYDNIEVMRDYGMTINDNVALKGAENSSGQTGVELATHLQECLDKFLVKNEDELIKGGIVRKQLLLSFHENFKTLLHSKDDKLSMHREAWKPIIANIALSIFSLIKLTVSKIMTHQATFFFQQTKRMQKIDAIDQSLDEVVQSNLSLV